MRISSALDAAELLSHLTREEIEFLEGVAVLRNLDAGQILFDVDTEAEEFYILVEGSVSLELVSPRRRPIVIQQMERGDLIGLSWFFAPYQWNWRARAIDETKAIAFDAALVRERCREDANLSNQIVTILAREAVKRLHAARTQLLDLYEFPR